MIIKQLLDEDFVNYKQPSMFIGFPTCTWKCEVECGKRMCQNSSLAHSPDIEVSSRDIVKRYLDNPITKAIVCGGLEPFDSFDDLVDLIGEFRKHTEDCIVIYTGYTENEAKILLPSIKEFKNIIIKFGRFVPNQTKHYDAILGVYLASNNQYGVKIS